MLFRYLRCCSGTLYDLDWLLARDFNDDTVGLFYDRSLNKFIDCDGYIVWPEALWEIISPSDMWIFRQKKCYMLLPHRTMRGLLVELFWPDDPENEIEDEPSGVWMGRFYG